MAWDSIPGGGTEIPPATWCPAKKKKKIKAILCVQRGILLIATMRQVVLIKQVFPRHNVSVVPWSVFVLTLLGNVPLRLENESSVFVL